MKVQPNQKSHVKIGEEYATESYPKKWHDIFLTRLGWPYRNTNPTVETVGIRGAIILFNNTRYLLTAINITILSIITGVGSLFFGRWWSMFYTQFSYGNLEQLHKITLVLCVGMPIHLLFYVVSEFAATFAAVEMGTMLTSFMYKKLKPKADNLQTIATQNQHNHASRLLNTQIYNLFNDILLFSIRFFRGTAQGLVLIYQLYEYQIAPIIPIMLIGVIVLVNVFNIVCIKITSMIKKLQLDTEQEQMSNTSDLIENCGRYKHSQSSYEKRWQYGHDKIKQSKTLLLINLWINKTVDWLSRVAQANSFPIFCMLMIAYHQLSIPLNQLSIIKIGVITQLSYIITLLWREVGGVLIHKKEELQNINSKFRQAIPLLKQLRCLTTQPIYKTQNYNSPTEFIVTTLLISFSSLIIAIPINQLLGFFILGNTNFNLWLSALKLLVLSTTPLTIITICYLSKKANSMLSNNNSLRNYFQAHTKLLYRITRTTLSFIDQVFKPIHKYLKQAHWDIQIASFLTSQILCQTLYNLIQFSQGLPMGPWTQILTPTPVGLVLTLTCSLFNTGFSLLISKLFYKEYQHSGFFKGSSSHSVKTAQTSNTSNSNIPKVFSSNPSVCIKKPFTRVKATQQNNAADSPTKETTLWSLSESITQHNLSLTAGSHLILGANGVGKSTLIEAFNEAQFAMLYKTSSDSLTKETHFKDLHIDYHANSLGISQMEFGKPSLCTQSMMQHSAFKANSYLQFLITEHLDKETAASITHPDTWVTYQNHILNFLTTTCNLKRDHKETDNTPSLITRLLNAKTSQDLGKTSGGEMQMINAGIINTLMTIKQPGNNGAYYNCIVLDEPCQAISVDLRPAIFNALTKTATDNHIIFICILHEDNMDIINCFEHIHHIQNEETNNKHKTARIQSIDNSYQRRLSVEPNSIFSNTGLLVQHKPKLVLSLT